MAIQTTQLGTTGPRVSRMGLGGCPLGGHGWGAADDRQAERAVAEAAYLGVDFFDTADCYGKGHSEELLSRALGERRHAVTIATKFGVRLSEQHGTWRDNSPEYLRTALEASLRRLRLDCVPLYYLHWSDGQTPIEMVMEELSRQKRLGKIGAIGLSNCTRDDIRRASQIDEVAAVQSQFSLVDQSPAGSLRGATQTTPTAMIAWGALAQGLLTGKFTAGAKFGADDRRSRYDNFRGAKFESNLRLVDRLKAIAAELGKTPAQVALRWVLDAPGADITLFGAKRPEQVRDNLGALGWTLPAECHDELTTLGRIAESTPAAAAA